MNCLLLSVSHLQRLFHLLAVSCTCRLLWLLCSPPLSFSRMALSSLGHHNCLESPPSPHICVFKIYQFAPVARSHTHNFVAFRPPPQSNVIPHWCSLRMQVSGPYLSPTVLLTIIITLHVRSPELIHLITGSFSAWTNISSSPSPPIPWQAPR